MVNNRMDAETKLLTAIALYEGYRQHIDKSAPSWNALSVFDQATWLTLAALTVMTWRTTRSDRGL